MGTRPDGTANARGGDGRGIAAAGTATTGDTPDADGYDAITVRWRCRLAGMAGYAFG